jgi:hypothetical protein
VRVDLDPELEIWLTEEFVNEERPTDGEMYCKIRQYHYQQRFGLKSKWMARLRGKRLANLKGLLEHEEMTQAFDALLDIPGLWGGMMLTTLHKLMAMHTHEVGSPATAVPIADVRRRRRTSDTSVISSKSGQTWSGATRAHCGGSTRLPSRPWS